MLLFFFTSSSSFSSSLWRARTLQHLSAAERLTEHPLYAPFSSIPSVSYSHPLLALVRFEPTEDVGTSSAPFFVPARDMDLWFYSIRIYWWRVLFLMSIFQDYLSSMLDCPPTCSCSQTEIYCNKSDNDRFFPLLALQDTGSNGTNVDIKELFKNITSMWVDARYLLLLSIPKSFRELKRFQAVCCFIRAGLMKGLLFICSTFLSHFCTWHSLEWPHDNIRESVMRGCLMRFHLPCVLAMRQCLCSHNRRGNLMLSLFKVSDFMSWHPLKPSPPPPP